MKNSNLLRHEFVLLCFNISLLYQNRLLKTYFLFVHIISKLKAFMIFRVTFFNEFSFSFTTFIQNNKKVNSFLKIVNRKQKAGST